jgi:hypothetical protein
VRTRTLAILDGGPRRSGRDPPARLKPRAEGWERKGADASAKYLTNKADYLDYPTALAGGWPIATGIIEGACRHIVKDRFDVTGARETGARETGARWSLNGAEAILNLRFNLNRYSPGSSASST